MSDTSSVKKPTNKFKRRLVFLFAGIGGLLVVALIAAPLVFRTLPEELQASAVRHFPFMNDWIPTRSYAANFLPTVEASRASAPSTQACTSASPGGAGPKRASCGVHANAAGRIVWLPRPGRPAGGAIFDRVGLPRTSRGWRPECGAYLDRYRVRHVSDGGPELVRPCPSKTMGCPAW